VPYTLHEKEHKPNVLFNFIFHCYLETFGYCFRNDVPVRSFSFGNKTCILRNYRFYSICEAELVGKRV
jgi:hypothetical protein